MKILVVDDDFDYASLVGTFLEAEGHQTTVLEHSPEALDVYLEERPDLVLLDIIMPYQDGIEVAEEIIGLDPDARITMVTALGDFPDDMPDTLRSKMHLLPKPLRLDRSLLSRIYPASHMERPSN
ncbi:MAG: response regulator [Planctomycetota bacterium]|nr:response regulator [Planctomycetota bacterium]